MASEIRVNRLSNRSGLSTITFANGGVQFSGITTFANGEFYVGTGATIINPGTNEFNFHTGGSNRFTINNSGANLGTGNITAVDATFTGNVSIGKTLTYEDVKNVDSVGVVTARTGVKITGGDFTVGTAITASSLTGNVTQDVGITTFSGSATWFKGLTANKDMYWSKSSGSLVFKDNAAVLFGNSSDLQISHIGTKSYIKDTGTGSLRICSDDFRVYNAADDEYMIRAVQDGAVDLYYNGNKKFETTNSGVSITGNISLTSSNSVTAGSIVLTNSSTAFTTIDGAVGYFGTGNDLRIYHDGSNNWIKSVTGQLKLETVDSIQLFGNNSETLAQFSKDGACYLYFNNSQKIQTTNTGVTVTGDVGATTGTFGGQVKVTSSNASTVAFSCGDANTGFYNYGTDSIAYSANGTAKWYTASNGNTIYLDDTKIFFGTGSDFRFWHDGNDNFIWGTGNHATIFATNGVERLRITSTGLVTNKGTWTNTYAANDTTQCGYQAQNLSDTTNTYAALRLTAGTNSPATAQLSSIRTGAGANDFTIQLETGNTAYERLRITSGGVLCVGATAADGDEFLRVKNKLLVMNTASTGDAFVKIKAGESGGSVLEFEADEGDDYADLWRVQNAGDGLLGFRTKASGSWVQKLSVHNDKVMFSVDAKVDGDNTRDLGASGARWKTLYLGTSARIGDPLGTAASTAGDDLVIEGNSDRGLSIISGTSSSGNIYFGDSGDTDVGRIAYQHNDNALDFSVNAAGTVVRIDTFTDSTHSTTSGVLGINDSSPGGEALALCVKSKQHQDSNLPVVHIERMNNHGGGAGNDEIALNVTVPNTHNNANDVYTIKSYAKHNLNATHFAGHFEARGSQYDAGGDGAAVYATTHKTDTNGGGYVPCFYAYGRSTYNANSNGYAVGMRIKLNAYEQNRGILIHHELTNSNWTRMISFHKGSGSNGTEVGSIKSSNNATQYNTSSDYRLKENVVDLTGAITRLKQLKPKRFNFKNDTSKTVDGFIAHEVEPVVPQAVSGTKDAVKIETIADPETGKTIMNEDGTPKIETVIDAQEVDYSKLSTLTIAALQEALAKIETLEAKVAALEGS